MATKDIHFPQGSGLLQGPAPKVEIFHLGKEWEKEFPES